MMLLRRLLPSLLQLVLFLTAKPLAGVRGADCSYMLLPGAAFGNVTAATGGGGGGGDISGGAVSNGDAAAAVGCRACADPPDADICDAATVAVDACVAAAWDDGGGAGARAVATAISFNALSHTSRPSTVCCNPGGDADRHVGRGMLEGGLEDGTPREPIWLRFGATGR